MADIYNLIRCGSRDLIWQAMSDSRPKRSAGDESNTSGLHKTSDPPGLDVAANPYGFDNEMLNDSTSLLHDHDDWHRSSFDD